MIRITGGALRGRVLPEGPGANVRPTASRVREALFSMIGQDLSGWSMLDLFGGTGLMAAEAASRGAGPVVVVEKHARTAQAIRANLQALGVPALVIVADAATARVSPADFVFLDPPYKEEPGPWLVRGAALARKVLVMEARAPVVWPDVEGWALEVARTYGDTALGVYLPAALDPSALDPSALDPAALDPAP